MSAPVARRLKQESSQTLARRIKQCALAARGEQLKGNLSDDFFDDIAGYLIAEQKSAWAARPRTYFMLRVLDRMDLMNDFVQHNVLDTCLPYSKERFPNFIADRDLRDWFLRKQSVVLDSVQSNLFAGAKHRHLNPDIDTNVLLVQGRQLGAGSQGRVHVVRERDNWREYARKVIRRPRTFFGDRDVLEMFHNEVHHLRQLDHRHLVKFISSYTDVDCLAIITEPVADMDLNQYLELITESGYKIPHLTHLRSLFGCLASAVLYLHQQNCRHKDIKPGNILLKNDIVLLTDFGTALDLSNFESDETTSTSPIYTTAYAAPELLQRSSRGYPADIFALGCVFLEMMTILKRQSLQSRDRHARDLHVQFKVHGHTHNSLFQWIQHLESLAVEPNVPFKWIRRMLDETPESRPKTTDLILPIQLASTEEHLYYGHCCEPHLPYHDVITTSNAVGMEDDTYSVLAESLSSQDIYYDSQAHMDDGQDLAVTTDILPEPEGINVSTNVDSRGTTTEERRDDKAVLRQSSQDQHLLHLPHRPLSIPQDTKPSIEADSTAAGTPAPTDSVEDILISILCRKSAGELEEWFSNRKRTVSQWVPTCIGELTSNVRGFLGRTLLHQAALMKDIEVACNIIDAIDTTGIPIDTVDWLGNTALHLAAWNGRPAIVEKLISRRAYTCHRNARGESAIHIGARTADTAILRVLVARAKSTGHSVHAQDSFGNTPLHYALQRTCSDKIALLMHDEIDQRLNSDRIYGATQHCRLSMTSVISELPLHREHTSVPSKHNDLVAAAVRPCEITRILETHVITETSQYTSWVACGCITCMFEAAHESLADIWQVWINMQFCRCDNCMRLFTSERKEMRHLRKSCKPGTILRVFDTILNEVSSQETPCNCSRICQDAHQQEAERRMVELGHIKAGSSSQPFALSTRPFTHSTNTTWTAIMACIEGNEPALSINRMVQLLLKRGGANCHKLRHNGRTMMDLAICQFQPGLIRLLRDSGGFASEQIQPNFTEMTWAIKCCAPLTVRLLDNLDASFALEVGLISRTVGDSALHFVISDWSERQTCFPILLARKKCLERMSSEGLTPLQYAMKLNIPAAAEQLLAAGAVLQQCNIPEGWSCPLLDQAIRNKQVDMCEVLLRAWARTNPPVEIISVMLRAAYQGSADVVVRLLDIRDSLEAYFGDGTLDKSEFDVSEAKVLRRMLEVRNISGHSGVLHHLAKFDLKAMWQCLPRLLACHYDVDQRDPHGNTPLHAAAIEGNIGMVTKLLQHGADSSVRNNDGKNAIDFAKAAGHWNIVERLN